MSEQERNRALVLEILDEVFHAGDPTAVQRYYAPDFHYTDPGAPQVTDREALAGLVGAMGAAFSGVRFTVHDLVAEGDKVVKRYTFSATHTGEFAGIPATGIAVEVPGMEIYTIRDGKVVDAVNIANWMGFLQQVGVIPAPEAAAVS